MAMISWSCTALLTLALVRADSYFHIPWWSEMLKGQRYLTAALGMAALILTQARGGLILLLTGALLIAHAYASFYQPSLRVDIPHFDYLLAPGISANWSFDIAKSYVFGLWTYLPGALLFLKHRQKNHENSSNKLAVIIGYLLLGLVTLNCLVACVQGLFNINFLAQGSGSAVAAQRAAGLLEDSGAAGMLLSLGAPFFIFYRSNQPNRVTHFPVSLGILLTILTVHTGGRSAALASICGLLLGLAIQSVHLPKVDRLKRCALIATCVFGLAGLVYFHRERPEVSRVLDFAAGFLKSKLNLLEVIKEQDPVRYSHWLVQWNSITHNPITGAGLGSFHAELAGAKDGLLQQGLSYFQDWPSSAYLTLPAELGIAGWLFLVCSFALFIAHLYKALVNAGHAQKVLPWLTASFALLLAFMIGIHIPNNSAYLLCVIVLAALITQSSEILLRFLRLLIALALLAMTFSIGIKAYTATAVPSFRWAQTGRPQIQSNFRETLNELPGEWLPARSEFVPLNDRLSFSFMIKNPPERLPTELEIFIKRNDGKVVMTRAFRFEKNPSLPVTLSLPSTECDSNFSRANYCFVKYSLKPGWTYDKYSMGLFLLESR